MRHKAVRHRHDWRWVVALGALVLLAAALVYQYHQSAVRHQRVEAAKELIAKSPDVAVPSDSPSGTPSPSDTPMAASSPSAPVTASPDATPTVQQLDEASLELPPVKFIWPAAGISVDIAPMDWSADKAIDPPLDANGFDPSGHWLKRTGQTAEVKPKVVAGHTCYSPDRTLCNSSTFPFNQLSFSGWAVGQPASIINTAGQTIDYTLLDRQVVDKSKAFSFKNDKCLLVAFTCYQDDPLGKIALVTFHRNQCT